MLVLPANYYRLQAAAANGKDPSKHQLEVSIPRELGCSHYLLLARPKTKERFFLLHPRLPIRCRLKLRAGPDFMAFV
jgi:hypothetical protein